MGSYSDVHAERTRRRVIEDLPVRDGVSLLLLVCVLCLGSSL